MQDFKPGLASETGQVFAPEAEILVAEWRHCRAVCVLRQRRRQQAAAPLEDARAFFDGLLRMFAVGKRVHHQHEVEGARANIKRLHVAFDHFDIAERLQPLARGRDHVGTGIHAYDRMRVRRQQFGQYAIAGGDVQHVAGFQQLQQGTRQGFPGAARRVMALHVASHAVGPAAIARTRRQHRRQALRIGIQHRVIDAVFQRAQQVDGTLETAFVETVIRRYAGATITHQPGFLELGEVRGNAWLRETQHRRQLRDGQLLAPQHRQEPHPRGVGQHAQQRGGGNQIKHSIFISG